jgi:CheY-like chemotaxis protein
MRSMPGLERMRLVALTGYGQADDRERTRDAGFDGHLVKPVEFLLLRQALQ